MQPVFQFILRALVDNDTFFVLNLSEPDFCNVLPTQSLTYVRDISGAGRPAVLRIQTLGVAVS